MFNFQMETWQNTLKYKNLNLAMLLGVTHLHEAKTFTMFTTCIFIKCTNLKDYFFAQEISICSKIALQLFEC